MAQRDSLDKVIGTYFACVTAKPFTYKGRVYTPKVLRVSPMIFRGFTCPAGCAGCCPRFSLDYLPDEETPPNYDRSRLVAREIKIDDRKVLVYSDMQHDHDDYHCRNVIRDEGELRGRCGVHGHQPFSCDFELIRFLEFAADDKPNHLTQKLFGRGWAMRRFDGKRGALCTMTPADAETTRDVVRRLRRLRQWCEHFGIDHKVDSIIEWAEWGPREDPLII
jgi:hypothetical protein